jgi:hypothetical protein
MTLAAARASWRSTSRKPSWSSVAYAQFATLSAILCTSIVTMAAPPFNCAYIPRLSP